MSPRDSGANGFPQTRWSLVRRAGVVDGPARGEDLDTLLRRYLPALEAYLRLNMKLRAVEADDLLQSFIVEKVVEHNLVSRADQTRGRFRSFLLCTLRNYALQRRRNDQAAYRMPASIAPLSDLQEVASDESDRSDQFDIEWARQTIAQTTARMQRECEAVGRSDVWTIFNERVIRPAFDGAPPEPYDHLVRRLGLTTPIQACNLLTTGKRMFLRCLREVVGDYANDADLDEEIAELRAVLASAGNLSDCAELH